MVFKQLPNKCFCMQLAQQLSLSSKLYCEIFNSKNRINVDIKINKSILFLQRHSIFMLVEYNLTHARK